MLGFKLSRRVSETMSEKYAVRKRVYYAISLFITGILIKGKGNEKESVCWNFPLFV